ncbi:MAG: hypothetical protein ACM3N4_03405, partial [Nitrososphaerota archaeon]
NGDVLHLGTVELRFEEALPPAEALEESLAHEEEELPSEESVAPGQTTVPLTRDALLPRPDGDGDTGENTQRHHEQ